MMEPESRFKPRSFNVSDYVLNIYLTLPSIKKMTHKQIKFVKWKYNVDENEVRITHMLFLPLKMLIFIVSVFVMARKL